MPLYPARVVPTYTLTNVTPDRVLDADNTGVSELGDVLATFIRDMTGN